jgi:hypothetical protein
MRVFMQIYVVDSLDRERIGEAKQEFQLVKSNFTIILYVCIRCHVYYYKQTLTWFMGYLQCRQS